ncbi:MAG: T9SS type A sorting domain-containing protein [Ignavibacteria bacterium]|nr:T9SS type A sorting domain-containing protein [Ignavibacteria bacterium]
MRYFYTLLLIIFAVVFVKISYSQNYSQVTVTGFTYDMIANGGPGTNQAYNTTNVIFDGDNAYAGHVMYSVDFRGNYNQTTAPEGGLPVNRLITSANNSAITYLLQPYNANNVLYLTNTNTTGTLTLSTPQSYQRLAILASSAEGSSSFTVRLNFNDSTYADYSFTVPDWFDGTGYAIQKIGRVNARNYSTTFHDRYDDIDGTTTNNPRLYDCFITLANNDMFKILTSIKFTKAVSGGSRTAVLAVCGLNPLLAPTALPATNVTSSAFRSNWTSAANATKYRLDVSTASDFSSFLTGYNNLDVGNVLYYDMSGLSSGTYYYRVRAENSYGQSIHSNTITAAIVPSTQASNIIFSNVTPKTFKISWTRGNGNSSSVFLYSGSSGTPSPSNGTVYNYNPYFQTGSQLGTSGWYCIYNGTGTSVTAAGLSFNTTYRAMVCETGGTTSPSYNMSTASNNIANQTTVQPSQAYNVQFSNILSNSMSINWTNGNGNKRCVFMKTGITGTASPPDSSIYTPSTIFGSGSQIGTTGWYCIYNGTAADMGNLDITNLSQSTSYVVMVCEYFGNTGEELYITTTAMLNPNNHETLLPVKLESFAFSTDRNIVTLRWKTSEEINNSGFDIERKNETGLFWEIAGTMKGAGNSHTPVQYEFKDAGLGNGRYSYRLKQIDYNGNHEYHYMNKTVEIGLPARFVLEQNYPNPFNPSTEIRFGLPEDSRVDLSVFDLTGRKIRTLINEMKPAGYYKIDFSTGNIASGIYIYRLNTEKYSVSKKMIILK